MDGQEQQAIFAICSEVPRARTELVSVLRECRQSPAYSPVEVAPVKIRLTLCNWMDWRTFAPPT
jgi:hypothetical protein